MPGSLVDDGAATPLAAQLGDVPKLGVHRVSLCVWQVQPGGEQRVRLGIRHRQEVEGLEEPAGVEVAGQQRVGHLPEEVSG